MAGFPLYTNIHGNNCTIFGGDEEAFRITESLLSHGAKVTIIAPKLSAPLEELVLNNCVRHLPRKYYRGDCSNGQLCFATTGQKTVDLAIVSECKAKRIPVCATTFSEYSTFSFPYTTVVDSLVLSLDGDLPKEKLLSIFHSLEMELEKLVKQ